MATKKGMTIREIIRMSVQSRKDSAANVNILATKTKPSVRGNPMAMAKTSSKLDASGNKKPNATVYITTIEVEPSGNARVSCSCEDFLYTWEFALAKKHAASVEYGNGEPPREKNPKLIPGACKHVIAFAQSLIKRKVI